jgi:spore germination protein KB
MKVQISGKQFFMIIYSYILASDLIRGIYSFSLKNNLWISELLGIIGSVIIFAGYLLIYRNNNYGSFTESIENISGKFLSRFIFLIYPAYFVLISLFTLETSLSWSRFI